MTQSRIAAGTAVLALVGLVGHFVVWPPPGSFSSVTVLGEAATHYGNLVTAAWLDAFGSIMLIVALVSLVEVAGRANTLAGRIVLLAGTAVVAQSLLSDTLVIAAAQISRAGSGATAAGMLQVAHAGDYGYPFANVFWATALGITVLRSRILAPPFGYVAIVFAALELIGGVAELYSDRVYAVVNPLFLVMVIWVVVAAGILALRSSRETSSFVQHSMAT